MDRNSAKTLITNTLCNKFDKTQYRNFIVNFLDGIDENKVFTCGNAYVPEAFREYITSYGRFGKYTDKNNETIEVLWVSLKKDTSLDRARTVQRNFVAWYLNGGRGGQLRKNALVAFYNEDRNDWRFSFVKLDTALIQDDKGKIKIVNNFTPAKRFSFLVGEFEPNHTAQSRLVSLLEKDYPTLDEIEEAFNVEKVSKEFFENYKELFLQLTEDLKNIRENEYSQRINAEFTLKSISDADFCKKLLGQLVFLYFIQKKGWLGVARDKKWGEGDKQFLRHTFERAINEGKNFFNDYLEPLFYNALANGERDDNWFGELDCKIPFLNGGLFERYHDYDWVNTDIVFDNTIFSNNKKTKNGDIGTGILDVFDRYNFTVKEDEPLEKEVAVDPEMLGKVFENLLEVQDRKSKGAFYTPREIVHYMCQESLINYLCTELGINEDNSNISDSTNLTKQDIEDFIHHSDKISQLENIATDKENENSKYKHIFSDSIKNNTKAIDKALEDIKICDPAIGSGAFPVGMLNEIVRARIALVESGFLPEAKKRTNYEYKRQAIQNSIYGVDIESGAVEIAKLRLWLSLVVDEEDIENIKALPNLDYKIVCGNSLLGVKRNLFNDALFKQLEELKPQFFNETRKSEKRRLKKQIDATIKELTKDGTFDFEIYFSEVFHEKGGFDVVIANPPYIDSETMFNNGMQGERDFIAKNYKWTKGNWDIYIAFFEKGYRLLTELGNMIYITPDKWLARPFGEILRLNIKDHILSILFAGRKIFETALVDSIITNISKQKCEKTNINKYFNGNINFIQSFNLSILPKPYTLDFLASDKIELLNKIELQPLKISNVCACESACATSDAYKLKPILKSLDNCKEYNDTLYKAINTGTIGKYYSKWSTNKIKYLKDEYDFPVINKSDFHSVFKNSYSKKVGVPKLIIKGLTLLYAYLDNQGIYVPCKSTLVIQSNNMKLIKILLAIINSNLAISYIKEKYASASYNGGITFNKDMINNFPIPKIENLEMILNIIDKILEITQSEDYLENKEKQDVVKEYEKQIDIMVYKLYDLTYQEVLTIDKNFELSEEEYNIYKYRNMQ